MIDNLYGIVTPQLITTDELPERPTMREVAAWLGMTYGTVRRMALDGSLPCKAIKRRANNVYLFDKAALLAWEKSETLTY